jgi:ribosomal protein S18 acetylase RimI-like enzyme
MTDRYTIEEAGVGQLDVIVRFSIDEALEAEGAAKNSDDVRRGVAAGLENPDIARYWVVVNDRDEVVASTSIVREWSDWHGGHYWWIQSLYIAPEHRGRGLVEKILDHLRTAARAGGAIDLRLYAHDSNRRALAVYRRCGFDVAPYTIMTRSLTDD